MDTPRQTHGDYGFVSGLLAGTVVGAALVMWLTPRSASELRHRVVESARGVGKRASDQYRQATTRVGEAVDELTRKGQDVRDEVAEAVARGAHEVERFATAAKTDRVPESGKQSVADRS